MRIIIDTREQHPFEFQGEAYKGVETVSGALSVGDYSLPNLSDFVAVERKSVDDLIGCLCGGRDRFKRELLRGRGLDCFAVVVEGSLDDIRAGRYRSKMAPEAAVQSVLAFQARYRVPFVFCNSRSQAERVTFDTLRHYLDFVRKKGKAADLGQNLMARD